MFSRQVIRFGCSAGYRGGWARLWAGIGTGIEVRLHGSLKSSFCVRCSWRLDDNGRELILESAFRVACADGVMRAPKIGSSEDRQLRAIAQALDIHEGVLELEILQFQRELAAGAA